MQQWGRSWIVLEMLGKLLVLKHQDSFSSEESKFGLYNSVSVALFRSSLEKWVILHRRQPFIAKNIMRHIQLNQFLMSVGRFRGSLEQRSLSSQLPVLNVDVRMT